MSEQYDEYPRPTVIHNCVVCRVLDKDLVENRAVVSPAGVAHFGDGGWTDCGKDATGDKWWWPL